MQFTKAEEYGILGVLHLADKERNAVTPLSEVSRARDVPEKFLAKIFQSLARSGIVRSHRGVRGGFTLAREPRRITVKEVLESIQGPYHLLRCIEDPGTCKKAETCAVRDLVSQAEERLVEVFQTNTIADLITREKAMNEARV